jgi:hypothetical protein
MKFSLFAILAFLFIASCNSSDNAPDFKTYKIIPDSARFYNETESLFHKRFANAETGIHPGLDSMFHLQLTYFSEKNKFNLNRFRIFWEQFRKEIQNRELSNEEVFAWVDLTGFLFQLTGEAMVAEEFERVVWLYFKHTPDMQPDSVVMPYVFTKNTDRIHVNLFLPAEISFEHSMGGKVVITQKTDFPQSGNILLVFGVETKQYIELYVRIPSWAENASVTVKGVKYVALPGSYSQIAKKWKQGDEAKVEISLENLPRYMTPGK